MRHGNDRRKTDRQRLQQVARHHIEGHEIAAVIDVGETVDDLDDRRIDRDIAHDAVEIDEVQSSGVGRDGSDAKRPIKRDVRGVARQIDFPQHDRTIGLCDVHECDTERTGSDGNDRRAVPCALLRAHRFGFALENDAGQGPRHSGAAIEGIGSGMNFGVIARTVTVTILLQVCRADDELRHIAQTVGISVNPDVFSDLNHGHVEVDAGRGGRKVRPADGAGFEMIDPLPIGRVR